MTVFAIEALVLIVFFTLVIRLLAKQNPLNFLQDYPEPIRERVKELGYEVEETSRHSKAYIVRKGIVALMMGLVLTFVLVKVNHVTTFGAAFLTAYGLWVIVDLYDILLDIVWFCHDESLIIPGTEDLVEAYHDYMFHVRASVRGLVIGLPVCVLAALLCVLVGRL